MPHIWQAVSPCSLLPSKEGPTTLFVFLLYFTYIMIYFLLYFIYTHTHTQRFNQILDFYRFDWTLSRFDLLYGSIVPSRLTFFSRKVSLVGTIEPYKRSTRTRLFIFTQMLRYWKNQWIINIGFSLKNLLIINIGQVPSGVNRIFESLLLFSNKLRFTPNGI